MTSAVAVSARARGRSIEVKARKLVGPATAHEAGESRERAGVYRFHYRESVEISTRPRLGIFPRRQRLQGTDRFRSSADWVAASRGAAAAEVSDADERHERQVWEFRRCTPEMDVQDREGSHQNGQRLSQTSRYPRLARQRVNHFAEELGSESANGSTVPIVGTETRAPALSALDGLRRSAWRRARPGKTVPHPGPLPAESCIPPATTALCLPKAWFRRVRRFSVANPLDFAIRPL